MEDVSWFVCALQLRDLCAFRKYLLSFFVVVFCVERYVLMGKREEKQMYEHVVAAMRNGPNTVANDALALYWSMLCGMEV